MNANSIPLTPVKSSQLAALGYNPDTETLAIQFLSKGKPGNVYHYRNFPKEEYATFAGAESAGAHFGKYIKPHGDKYPFTNMGMPSAGNALISGAEIETHLAAKELERDHAQALDINARCYGREPLPSGQRYSRNTFKDNGDPILLDAYGKRSVFCDLNDDVEAAA